MGRNAAMVVAGMVTAFVMMIVVGLLALGGRFDSRVAAAGAPDAAPLTVSNDSNSLPSDVAALRAQVQQDEQQLQQANQDLQDAYNQIQVLRGQLAGQAGRFGNGRGDDFRGQRGGNSGGQSLPFNFGN